MTTQTYPQAPGGEPARVEPAALTGTYAQEIAGRYRRITTHQLALAWWLHQQGRISRRQLRIFFAAHEMDERRQAAQGSARTPRYGLPEIKALVGGRGSASADRDLSADVAQLRKLGLVSITPERIAFAASIEQLALEEGLEDFWAFFHAMPHPRRTVPVPRRTLRALAGGFRRAETALMIAMLIRSVFWHRDRGSYRTDGRTKLSWVADTFGLSRRAVTTARAHLVDIGWLVPLEAPQWALNRWGAHDAVNTDWTPAPNELPGDSSVENSEKETDTRAVGEGGGSGGSASPRAGFSGGSASPCLNRSSSSTRNQETRTLGGTPPGPAGGWPAEEGKKKRRAPRRRQQPRDKAPNLRDVQPHDLRDPEAVRELHRQAVARGLACDSEAGQLDFFAMAARASSRGHRPGALLLWLLQERKREFITAADEERASDQLRELRSGPIQRSGDREEGDVRDAVPRALSEEERVVQACLQAAKKSRRVEAHRLARAAKGWSREQWDAAHLRYVSAQATRAHTLARDDQAVGLREPGVLN